MRTSENRSIRIRVEKRHIHTGAQPPFLMSECPVSLAIREQLPGAEVVFSGCTGFDIHYVQDGKSRQVVIKPALQIVQDFIIALEASTPYDPESRPKPFEFQLHFRHSQDRGLDAPQDP